MENIIRGRIMSKKDVNIYSFNDECYVYLGDYKKLQQENQQLKEELQKANDTLDTHNELIKYQKSVLDEIRELIDKYEMGRYDYSIPVFEIKMILDKVKNL